MRTFIMHGWIAAPLQAVFTKITFQRMCDNIQNFICRSAGGKRPPSGHERNDSLVPRSKSVNGPTGGQGTVGGQALSGFLRMTVRIVFLKTFFLSN